MPNILVVDDTVINRFLLSEIIESIGSKAIQARSGKDALEKLESHAAEIDIIFMDIEMPDMNGIETTAHIRKNRAIFGNIPIVAISAYDPDAFWDDFKQAGFDGFINKPYTIDKIQKILEKVIT